MHNCTLDEIPKIYGQWLLAPGETALHRHFQLDFENKPTICDIPSELEQLTEFETYDGSCELGTQMVKNDNDTYSCYFCPEGTGTFIVNQTKCTGCDQGAYLQQGISLTQFEKFPSQYNFSSYCYTKDSYSKDTYCTESDGFYPILAKGLYAGEREILDSKIYLQADLFVDESSLKQYEDPHVKLTFEAVNFKTDLLSIYLNNKLMSKQ